VLTGLAQHLADRQSTRTVVSYCSVLHMHLQGARSQQEVAAHKCVDQLTHTAAAGLLHYYCCCPHTCAQLSQVPLRLYCAAVAHLHTQTALVLTPPQPSSPWRPGAAGAGATSTGAHGRPPTGSSSSSAMCTRAVSPGRHPRSPGGCKHALKMQHWSTATAAVWRQDNGTCQVPCRPALWSVTRPAGSQERQGSTMSAHNAIHCCQPTRAQKHAQCFRCRHQLTAAFIHSGQAARWTALQLLSATCGNSASLPSISTPTVPQSHCCPVLPPPRVQAPPRQNASLDHPALRIQRKQRGLYMLPAPCAPTAHLGGVHLGMQACMCCCTAPCYTKHTAYKPAHHAPSTRAKQVLLLGATPHAVSQPKPAPAAPTPAMPCSCQVATMQQSVDTLMFPLHALGVWQWLQELGQAPAAHTTEAQPVKTLPLQCSIAVAAHAEGGRAAAQ
jgi:hypothetical protein